MPEYEELLRRVEALEGKQPGPVPPQDEPYPLEVFNVLDYGARADGLSDDSGAFQRAVTAAEDDGGGAVYFPAGTYIISSTVTLPAKNIYIYGAGLATIIKGDADPLIQSSTDATNSHLVLANFKIEPTKSSAAQKGVKVAQVWSSDPKASLMIDNVWFLCNGHVDSAMLYIEGVREGSVSNCWFESTTGGRGTGVEMHANGTNGSVMNITVNACQFITPKQGVYLHRSGAPLGAIEGIRIEDCLFVGGTNGLVASGVLSLQVIGCMLDNITGSAAVLTGTDWPSIVGNWFGTSGASGHGISLTGPALSGRIADNFFSSAHATKGDGVRVEATPGAVVQWVIEGNTFIGVATGVNFGLAGGTINQMVVTGNAFKTATNGVHLGSATPRANNVVADNVFATVTNPVVGGNGTNHVHHNDGWVTENYGVVTLLAANTSVVVTHGLNVQPINAANINLMIAANPAADIGFFYISGVGATQFTINTRAAPGSNLGIGWQVVIPFS